MRQLKITKQVTNRETASLDKYLQEIGKVDLITAEEEVELAQRIKAGDQIALEKLTKANLRFVVSVANTYGGAAFCHVLSRLPQEASMLSACKFDDLIFRPTASCDGTIFEAHLPHQARRFRFECDGTR